MAETMELSINEATVHLVVAAYRLGACDAKAEPPKDLLMAAIKLVQSDDEKTSQEIVSSSAVRA